MTTSRNPRGPYPKSIKRRERILDAALEAFAELGDRGTSLQEIADRVGVKHSSLMYYFSSREELLLAALERRDALLRRSGQESREIRVSWRGSATTWNSPGWSSSMLRS
ncbi:helix-turn-helix domain containing protein [Streptomyces mirabilis]|nr:helix-turn-helix domain containing protein [Streptomyces mirabilis]